jgi:DNA-binding NarL/FixJ family response regulator
MQTYGTNRGEGSLLNAADNLAGQPAIKIAVIGPCPDDNTLLAGQIGKLNRGWQAECHGMSGNLAPILATKLPNLAIINDGTAELMLIHCLQGLRLRIPALQVLIHGVLPEMSLFIKGIMAGACGWLEKPATSPDLETAITETLAGGNRWSGKARHLLVNLLHQAGARAADLWHLTARETQILTSLVYHPGDKEIAQALNLSPNMAHNHLSHIYEKLQVHTRRDALTKCLSINSITATLF